MLCFKRVHRDKDGGNPYCDEYEVKIEDPEITLQLFEQLGFTSKTEIKKYREVYTYETYEISCDYIEGLGHFIEVELKKQEDNPLEGLKDVESFLRNILGVLNYTKQSHGYATMMWNPNYDFGIYE